MKDTPQRALENNHNGDATLLVERIHRSWPQRILHILHLLAFVGSVDPEEYAGAFLQARYASNRMTCHKGRATRAQSALGPSNSDDATFRPTPAAQQLGHPTPS